LLRIGTSPAMVLCPPSHQSFRVFLRPTMRDHPGPHFRSSPALPSVVAPAFRPPSSTFAPLSNAPISSTVYVAPAFRLAAFVFAIPHAPISSNVCATPARNPQPPRAANPASSYTSAPPCGNPFEYYLGIDTFLLSWYILVCTQIPFELPCPSPSRRASPSFRARLSRPESILAFSSNPCIFIALPTLFHSFPATALFSMCSPKQPGVYPVSHLNWSRA
jgi:hypothetical protein